MSRSRWLRWGQFVALLLILGYVSATVVRVYVRKYYLFLPGYVHWAFSDSPAVTSGPTHVFLIYVDHFEPGRSGARTQAWMDRYTALAARHHDADNRPPQHTWFYPGEQPSTDVFRILQTAMHDGLGEVELHFHHGYDTTATLRAHMQKAIDRFQQYGFLKTADGSTHFAFVHGNFGLDNGNGDQLCGVDDELTLLRQLGAFADFTFPSIYMDSQPAAVNAIYAAKDDPQPKSYNHVYPLSTLENGRADLMIFEGPLLLMPSTTLRHLFIDVEDGDIHAAVPATPERVDAWIRTGVHVPKRPDWLFVKIFTHGVTSAAEQNAAIGPSMDAALSYLEQHYNDGHKYVLHYITAREAYNLALAAADGLQGEPEQYFDRTIPPYIASAPRPPAASAQRAIERSTN